MKKFRALMLEKEDGKVISRINDIALSDLPDEEVLIKVTYSSLNYKDGLAVTGRGKIVREYPFIPGIDLAGIVEESRSPEYKPGDAVILTGWGTGERHWGGFAEYARAKADWLVPLPKSMSLKQAMGLGTAGLTAMLSVMALEKYGVQKDREIVVTGAGGGVGSLSVALLGKLGFNVTASTGRESAHSFLKSLGAKQIIDREQLSREGNPLESQRWGGAIDTVGGTTLAGILRSMSYYGTVASCGLAGGSELNTTVFPFILRGVKLVGIDSNTCPKEIRSEAWQRLAALLPDDVLNQIIEVHPLSQIPELSEQILAGKIRGRVVIDVKA
jgi:acrylyl-CoA reductase (NADPH)